MAAWACPLPLELVATQESLSFRAMPTGWTGVPLAPHPGAFGVRRRHHTHEGVDLYAPEGTPVYAVESGRVVRVENFTGASAGSPWWEETQAVFIEGVSGVVVYGELHACVVEGGNVEAGQCLGHLTPVLRQDKGRPMTMLHLELHAPGTRQAPAWEDHRPDSLQDPTPYLLALCAPLCPLA